MHVITRTIWTSTKCLGVRICDGYSEKEKAEKEKWDRILKNSKRMGDENRARHGRGTSGNAPYNSIDIYEY